MNELFRRVVLVACLGVAVGLLRYADLGEYLVFSQLTESSLRNPTWGVWSMSAEDKARLKTLPIRQLIKEREETSLVIADSGPPGEFLLRLKQSFEERSVAREWRAGADYSISDLNALWLRAGQIPADISGGIRLPHDLDQVILAGSESDEVFYRLRKRIITADDYEAFNGFSGSTPPVKIFYPYRFQAIFIIVVGLLVYLFLPWAKPIPDAVHTKRWKVMFLDFAALWLFLPFFLLGWFMAGPVSVGPNGGWIIAGVLWLMSLGGLFLFKQGTFYALFYMKAEDDGLSIRTIQGGLKLPYADVEKVQGAVLRNPRWLTVLLALAAIFGKGSQSYLASGQALIMGSARYPGMALNLKQGGTVYLWASVQGDTFEQTEQFIEGLKRAGVTTEDEALEVTGFGTEPRFDKVHEIDCGWMAGHALTLLLAAPFFGVFAAYLFGVMV